MKPPTIRRVISLMAMLAAVAMLAAACNSSSDDDTVAAGDETTDDQGTDGDVTAGDSTDDGEMADDESADDDAADGEMTDDESTGGGAGYPIDVETSSGVVTIPTEPTSIVSLSPTATEILFAIGAGDRVAAVDTYSNYPPDAPEGTLDGFAPDLESILAANPDLVVSSGLPEDITSALAENDIPVIFQPAAATFDDTYDQVAQLGEATGQVDEAATVNADIRKGIDDVVAGLPEGDGSVRVFHEIDDSFYTASSSSFIGQVYATMGFTNIADPLDPDESGFPLIDGEAVIAADPTLIVFTDQVTYGADDIAARPGWDAVSAVANDGIVQVDADVASRWGPRIVEFMQTIADAVAAVNA